MLFLTMSVTRKFSRSHLLLHPEMISCLLNCPPSNFVVWLGQVDRYYCGCESEIVSKPATSIMVD
jgi:hypothetical protein